MVYVSVIFTNWLTQTVYDLGVSFSSGRRISLEPATSQEALKSVKQFTVSSILGFISYVAGILIDIYGAYEASAKYSWKGSIVDILKTTLKS